MPRGSFADVTEQMKIGKVLNNFKCNTCKLFFRSEHELNEHIAALHSKDEKRFQCPLCESTFSLKWNRNTHVNRVHHKKRPYPCHCNARFATVSDLKRHKRLVHKECPECPRKFSAKEELKEHMTRKHRKQ